MSGITNNGRVPRLRFPEFREAEVWCLGRIADIAEVLQGYGFPVRYQGQTTGEYPFYKVSDISNTLVANEAFIEKSANYITADVLKELKAKPIPEGTTIFAKIGEAIRSNKRAITTTSCLIDNNAAGVKRIQGKSTDLFVYYTMEMISLIDYSGGVVPSVNKSAIENVIIMFPAIAEQQKIADCLSSLDNLITLEAQKLDGLKAHKKGLMQELFPREGETQPRLRFPEFQKAGDWKLKKIGDILVETQRPIELSDDNEYRLVTVKRRYGGLISRGIMKGQEILVKSQFVVRTEDFLISKRQIVHNACGLVTQELDGSVVSNEYSVLTPKPECSIEFFSWFAMQPAVSASFMNCSVGIVIEKMLFKLPAWLKQEFLFPTLPEQQRIASCLSSLDDLITAQTQKLEALKIHKKGLMQQLFPQVSEE